MSRTVAELNAQVNRHYVKPFRYDCMVQCILDGNQNMALDVRGFGRLEKEDDPDEIIDAFGKRLERLMNDKL